MKLTISLVLSALLTLSGCDFGLMGASQTITGSGKIKEENRPVDRFHEVDISSTFEASITIGPESSIQLAVDDNLLGLVETRVRDGRLQVRFAEGTIVVTNTPPKVTIVVPGLDLITSRGASKVSATIGDQKEIRIEAEGASSVEVRGLACESVDLKAIGAGRVTLVGKAKGLTLEASGASKLMAAEASFESANVSIEGSSRCEVNVTGSISGETTGASLLTVLGNPSSRSVKPSGVSHVVY